jgi:3-oxoacyl-[acyl-carrier-protein] synthase II
LPARVVVTGIGVVTPIGLTVRDFWEHLTHGVSGVRPISRFDCTGLPVRIAGEVPDFDPSGYMETKQARRMERFAQFAVAASRMAVDDAGLSITPETDGQIGIVINTGVGGISRLLVEERVRAQKGPDRVSPLLVPMLAPNMAATQPAICLGIHGPVFSGTGACAAGALALYEALRLIQHGEVQTVLAGGTESCLDPLSLASLTNMHGLSRRNDEPAGASRPFDRDRDGFVLSEGAAVLVLEDAEHALRRGARILCEVAGAGVSCDANHITDPLPGGEQVAVAMRKALREARLDPSDVAYIAAHATATAAGDVAETHAIRAALGAAADHVAVSANKSMLGHTFGAAGALSAVCCVLAIATGIIPPTINLETPDPVCDLDYVPGVARRQSVPAALANAFGFGGQNAVLAFRDWRQYGAPAS